MFVPRPLASRRQKTRLRNTDNSRFGDSGKVGSRNSRLTVYSRRYIDATRPSNDTFSASYRFFGRLPAASSRALPQPRAQSGGPPGLTHDLAGGRAQHREARGRASRGSRTVRFDAFRDPGSEIAVTEGPSFWSWSGQSSVAGGGVIERGVVAVARPCHQLASAVRRNHFDGHAAEGAVAPHIRRIVGQGVLVADVMRHLLANVVHVFDVLREIGNAAGSSSDVFQRALGLLRALLAFLAQQPDGVDHRVRLLNLVDGFLEREMTGIIFPVGDNQKDMLVAAGLFQVIDGTDDGVVKRGAAA